MGLPGFKREECSAYEKNSKRVWHHNFMIINVVSLILNKQNKFLNVLYTVSSGNILVTKNQFTYVKQKQVGKLTNSWKVSKGKYDLLGNIEEDNLNYHE